MSDFAKAFIAALATVGIVVWTVKIAVEALR
jgi:hypothetical protein